MKTTFQQQLQDSADAVNNRLEQIMSVEALTGEVARPRRLVDAMRHGLLNGGKRLRPFLVIQTAALFDVAAKDAMQTACALECLHSYSLIHDDLPAMDDDDLRRGKPTVHKAYDEATAILAGDALLTLAFDLLTDEACHSNPQVRAELANKLARASGLGGMIGGQMLDLAAETSNPDEAQIRLLQRMKTGALIRYACLAGAILGQASPAQLDQLTRYGETTGLAFQLADDLLDVTSNAETMGKAVGKDADRCKGTLVGIFGVEAVEKLLAGAVEDADASLVEFGDRADVLRQTARFIVERSS
ncbi:MAG: polyprenyl synthetase family protein [Rhizobiaceae bacterium]